MCVALPVVLFMLFAVATIMMTFTGFVIVEGTLITVASVMLFAFLAGLLVVSAFAGAAVMAAYVAFTFVGETLFPGRSVGGGGGRDRATGMREGVTEANT